MFQWHAKKKGILMEIGRKFITDKLIEICSQPNYDVSELEKIGIIISSGFFNSLEVPGTHWSDECEIDYTEITVDPRFFAFYDQLEPIENDELEVYKLSDGKVVVFWWEEDTQPIRVFDSEKFASFTYDDWWK
jgi:hypothetical protein